MNSTATRITALNDAFRNKHGHDPLDTGGEFCRLVRTHPALCHHVLHTAERWRSPAAGSGSDAGADAGGSQVQCVVRPLRRCRRRTMGRHCC